jgi:hypothetical protein
MGNKSLRKRKYDRTRDDTRQIEQRKELYRRKKQEHANIEEINDDMSIEIFDKKKFNQVCMQI